MKASEVKAIIGVQPMAVFLTTRGKRVVVREVRERQEEVEVQRRVQNRTVTYFVIDEIVTQHGVTEWVAYDGRVMPAREPRVFTRSYGQVRPQAIKCATNEVADEFMKTRLAEITETFSQVTEKNERHKRLVSTVSEYLGVSADEIDLVSDTVLEAIVEKTTLVGRFV